METGAGLGLDIPDDAYARAGARITGTRQAWESAGLLPKLKAPSIAEVQQIRPGTAIAALFHAEGTPDVVAELSRDHWACESARDHAIIRISYTNLLLRSWRTRITLLVNTSQK